MARPIREDKRNLVEYVRKVMLRRGYKDRDIVIGHELSGIGYVDIQGIKDGKRTVGVCQAQPNKKPLEKILRALLKHRNVARVWLCVPQGKEAKVLPIVAEVVGSTRKGIDIMEAPVSSSRRIGVSGKTWDELETMVKWKLYKNESEAIEAAVHSVYAMERSTRRVR